MMNLRAILWLIRPEYVYQPGKLIPCVFSNGSEFLFPREETQA